MKKVSKILVIFFLSFVFTYATELSFTSVASAEVNPAASELIKINSLDVNKETPTGVGTPLRWTVNAEGTNLSYAWYIYKDGQYQQTIWYSGKNYLDWTPNQEGQYKVQVWVKDNAGNFLTQFSSEQKVISILINSLKSDMTGPTEAGTAIRWIASAQGKGLTYAWYIYKDGKYLDTVWYSSKSYLDWIPKESGKYKVQVWVKDIVGNYLTQFSDEQEVTSIIMNSIKSNQTVPITAGTTIRWTASAQGKGLAYAWYIYKDGKYLETIWYSSKNYLDWIPKEAGHYKVQVWVKDSAGNSLNDFSTEQEVMSIIMNSLKSNKIGQTVAGTTIRWTASAQGKGLTYAWYIYKDGKYLDTVWYSSKNYLDWTPQESGNYKVQVWIKDSAGNYLNRFSTEQEVLSIILKSLKSDKTGPTAAGTNVRWTANAQGKGLTYAWYIYREGEYLDTIWYSAKNYLDWKPTQAGNYQIQVWVKDDKGNSVFQMSQVHTVGTLIMGQTEVTKERMFFYLQNNNNFKSDSYINNFVNFVMEEATIEGVRADVAFAQMMKETNFLKFGGDVKESQNNFGGLGATGNGEPGLSFPDIRTGVRAHIQHLKGYATTEQLVQTIVDPRYKYVKLGSAPFVEWLGIKENPNGAGWATDPNYGYNIVDRVKVMKNIKIVVLDAGHGGNDGGADAENKTIFERNLNMELTDKIYSKLQTMGVNVLLTRNSNDTYLSLQDRIKFANDVKGDLFLSIHHDSIGDKSANGFSVHYSSYHPGVDTKDVYIIYKGKRYPWLGEDTEKRLFYYSDKGVKRSISYDDATAYDNDISPSFAAQLSASMAKSLETSIAQLGIYKNRRTQDHNLYVTRWTNMPSVLIEAGFISNTEDLKNITSSTVQDKMAQKIAEVLSYNYFNKL